MSKVNTTDSPSLIANNVTGLILKLQNDNMTCLITEIPNGNKTPGFITAMPNANVTGLITVIIK